MIISNLRNASYSLVKKIKNIEIHTILLKNGQSFEFFLYFSHWKDKLTKLIIYYLLANEKKKNNLILLLEIMV